MREPSPANERRPEPRRRRMVVQLAGWALASVGPVLLLGWHLALYSAHKYFWADEILSYYQIDHPTVAAMLDSLRSGMNLMPPLWFLLAWQVQAFGGADEMWLRALSSVFLGAAVPVLGWGLWRSVGRGPTLLALSAGLLSSRLFLLNNTEARPYGLMFFWVALIAALWLRAQQQERAARWLGVGLALATAGLIATHYFGGCYALAALVTQIWADRRRGWWRPEIYLGYVVGALVALAWVAPIMWEQIHWRGGEGTGWIPPVNWTTLRPQLVYLLKGLVPAALLLGFLWLLRARAGSTAQACRAKNAPADPAPILLAAAWLLLPLLFLVLAAAGSVNFFIERYFFPSLIGWVIALAWVAGELVRRGGTCVGPLVARLLLGTWLIAWSGYFISRGAAGYGGFDQGAESVRMRPEPKVTPSVVEFSKGVYFSRKDPAQAWWYLTTEKRDVAAFHRFHPSFQAKLPGDLADVPEFIYIDAAALTGRFDFKTWLKAQPFTVVAKLPAPAYQPRLQCFIRGIYEVKRLPASVKGSAPVGE